MFEKIAVPLAGGILAGIAASACCVGPLVLLLLGFSGAWLGNLTALEPYRPVFIGIAFVALFIAYQRIYRPKLKQSCEQGETCAKPQANNLYNWLFTGVLVVVLTSIVSPYLVPLIYG
jgi:mercuric ion transport protein